MLLELAKPVALLLCLLSLVALFHTAFLSIASVDSLLPGPVLDQRIVDSILLLGLTAAISLLAGLLFREDTPLPHPSLSATLPVQIFYWSTGIMLLLFVVAHYLETHCDFYRSTNRW